MKNYEKPVVIANNELAEGVYAASGDCYTFTSRITQSPETGNPNYVIQIDGKHEADDGHHSSERTVRLVFNQPVQYVESNAASVSGDGTSSLDLTFVDGVNGSYHNNGVDNIGLGQLKVKSGDGLAILDTYAVSCNHTCTYEGH